MREQGAAARGFPFQPLAEPGGIDAQQHEIAFAGEMLGGGFRDLAGAGEMDEAIAQVDRARRGRFPRVRPSRQSAAGQIL